MRRSNRNIETFDISLMAVVTKAMGAFLVLMLLLMPYYSSGPIGQQAAADLAKKVEQADLKIREVIDKLNKASPEDLRKLLDEALKLLEEARKLISELKRANDALQAQVKRLEEQVASLNAQVAALNAQVAQLQNENKSLRAQVTQLQNDIGRLENELAKYKVSALLATGFAMGCGERVNFIIASKDSYIKTPDNKSVSVLNYGGLSIQAIDATDYSIIVMPANTGTYYLIAVLSHKEANIEKLPAGGGVRLARLTVDCEVAFGVGMTFTGGLSSIVSVSVRRKLAKDSYAVLLTEIVVTDRDFVQKIPSPDAEAWLAEQLRTAIRAN